MNLQDYRREIDRVDGELARLFAERMALTAEASAYKRRHGLGVLDLPREAERFAAAEASVPERFAGYGTALYASVLELSRAAQERAAGAAENLVLIGMPGCGKTTLGRRLGERLGRAFVDSDALAEALTGMAAADIFARWGEDAFRALETRALALLCARAGIVAATGGGCVTRRENWPLLRLCGKLVWVRRDVDALARDGRPLSLARGARELYAEREPLYRELADAAVDNNGSLEGTVEQLLRLV